MNRNLQLQYRQRPRTRRVVTALAGVVAAFALAAAAPAMASVISFDTLAPAVYNDGIVLSDSGFNLLLQPSEYAAAYGLSGYAGIVVSAANPYSCDVSVCPTGASGNYLGVVNDSSFKLTSASASLFTVQGFDYAFMAPVGGLGDFSYGQLQLRGTLADGSVINTALALPGQDSAGVFHFAAADLGGAFSSYRFSSVTINACSYFDYEDGAGLQCVNSLEQPSQNLSQFGIDNISVTAVPEPTTYLMLLAGLGGIAYASRRRARAAARAANLLVQGN